MPALTFFPCHTQLPATSLLIPAPRTHHTSLFKASCIVLQAQLKVWFWLPVTVFVKEFTENKNHSYIISVISLSFGSCIKLSCRYAKVYDVEQYKHNCHTQQMSECSTRKKSSYDA